MRFGATLLVCLALMTGMAQAQNAAPLAAQSDLLTADRNFSRLSLTRGRAHAFLAMATNNARLFEADGIAPVQGRAQAFRALGRRQNGRMGWEPLTAGVSPDGRMGWTDGSWQVTRGATVVQSGHYLTVWVKDRRNAWKVQASMNSAAPPSGINAASARK
jgi:hypothetical protein